MIFRFCLLLIAIPLCAHAEHTVLEVIPLKYRSVEEVLPVLQPFVNKEGALSGMNGQLIVRASPASLAQIQKILAKIDTLPKRLRILVQQGVIDETEKQGAQFSGQVNTGDVRLSLPAGKSKEGATLEANGARARIWSSTSAKREGVSQEIQVMEGKPALIHVGQALPIRERVVHQGATTRIVESARYEEIGTGFYVLPRINGDRVTLEISPQKQQLSSDFPQGYKTQNLNTTISARLGEWIELGAVFNGQKNNDSGLVYGTRKMTSEQRKIWVKVEEQP